MDLAQYNTLRCTFLVWTVILLTACSPRRDAHIFVSRGHVVVDSTALGKDLLPFDQRSNDAYYPVYYIGKPSDTLYLGHQPISMFSNQELEGRYDTAKNWNSASDMRIEVFVDTTSVGHEFTYSHFAEGDRHEILDSTKVMKAFIVFITNTSDSLVMMGSHNFVGHLTREVKDHDGSWIDVERQMTDLCGTAKRSLVLEPGDIIIAKGLRYRGDTKVSCRLRLSMNVGDVEVYRTYSNVFDDYFDVKHLSDENVISH